MPGRRGASIDLPDPGGPIISRLWPPAAAISSARFAVSWPLTSARSGQAASSLRACGVGGASTCVPLRWLISASSDGAARTSVAGRPGRLAALRRRADQRRFCALAWIAAGSTPATGAMRAVERRARPTPESRRSASSAITPMRGQQAERDRQVEVAALLGEVGRRQVDRDPLRRQRQAHGRSAPRAPARGSRRPPCRAGRRWRSAGRPARSAPGRRRRGRRCRRTPPSRPWPSCRLSTEPATMLHQCNCVCNLYGKHCLGYNSASIDRRSRREVSGKTEEIAGRGSRGGRSGARPRPAAPAGAPAPAAR